MRQIWFLLIFENQNQERSPKVMLYLKEDGLNIFHLLTFLHIQHCNNTNIYSYKLSNKIKKKALQTSLKCHVSMLLLQLYFFVSVKCITTHQPTQKINSALNLFRGDLVDGDDARYELITYDMVSESSFLSHLTFEVVFECC